MFRKEEIDAEWQKEPGPFGKIFRMVDGIKEYEPTIMTSYGEMTVSRYNRMKAREEDNDNE